MSDYPPPPQADDAHYNALHPAQPGAEVETDNMLAHELQRHAGDYPGYQPAAYPPQQQPPQHFLQHPTNHTYPSANPPDNVQTPGTDGKLTRLRKACDTCSARKVKCDEGGPPCKACVALGIDCTYDRPTKRRGPPNKHAVKRQRVDDGGGSSQDQTTLATSSPTHADQALAAMSSNSSAPLSAETICPTATIDVLIDQFFTYIYPLCPFPHEPSFRTAWKDREDLKSKPFLALLSSMVALLVASYPRKARLHLEAQIKDSFPNHTRLVERCQAVCFAARGFGYLSNGGLSVYDAVTSYFLGLTAMHLDNLVQGKLYISECTAILTALDTNNSQKATDAQLGALLAAAEPQDPVAHGSAADPMALEMSRRIIVALFVNRQATLHLCEGISAPISMPSISTDLRSSLPMKLDDVYISQTALQQQPEGSVATTLGLIRHAKIYNAYDDHLEIEKATGRSGDRDWERQLRVLHAALRGCQDILAGLPSALRYSSLTQVSGETNPLSNGADLSSPAFQDPANAFFNQPAQVIETTPKERRDKNHEIQAMSIYAASLIVRASLCRKYWALAEVRRVISAAPEEDKTMCQEQEGVVRQLCAVLGGMNHINVEPNADAFNSQMRSLGRTVLATLSDAQMGLRATEPLRAFLDGLSALESEEVDEAAVWAGLGQAQQQLALLGRGMA